MDRRANSLATAIREFFLKWNGTDPFETERDSRLEDKREACHDSDDSTWEVGEFGGMLFFLPEGCQGGVLELHWLVLLILAFLFLHYGL